MVIMELWKIVCPFYLYKMNLYTGKMASLYWNGPLMAQVFILATSDAAFDNLKKNLRHSLQWRHNERDGVSNHIRLHCLLNRLFRRRSKKTSKLRVTGLREGNPPVTGGLPSQRACNAENVFIWWRYHNQIPCTYQLQQTLCRKSNFNGDIRSSVIPRYRPFVVTDGIQQILQQPSLVLHAGCVIGTCKWNCLKPLGNAFSWMKSFVFWFEFHWGLFLGNDISNPATWKRMTYSISWLRITWRGNGQGYQQ